MRLTEQQVNYFDTFGFLAFPGLFADEAGRISDAFESIWAMHGGGHDGRPHDHQRRSALAEFIDQEEFLSSLIDDPRIDDVAASLLGDDYNYTGSDGNYYVGDTQWHSDRYVPRKYMSFKMAFYLDPVTQDSGCLRVIPGSHKLGDAYADSLQPVAQQPRLEQAPAMWGISPDQMPAVPLNTQPGDLIMFNHRTKHASFGGSTSRRMFTLNFQERFAEEDLPILREEIGEAARFWRLRAYGEVMIRTAGPKRMRHLEQRLTNDGHLTELTRKAKEEMGEPSRS